MYAFQLKPRLPYMLNVFLVKRPNKWTIKWMVPFFFFLFRNSRESLYLTYSKALAILGSYVQLLANYKKCFDFWGTNLLLVASIYLPANKASIFTNLFIAMIAEITNFSLDQEMKVRIDNGMGLKDGDFYNISIGVFFWNHEFSGQSLGINSSC